MAFWSPLKSRPVHRANRGRARQPEESEVRLPQALAVLEQINTGLSRIEERLSRLERLAHGGRAVFLGNGRILAKASIGETSLGYLLEADDRLLVPQFVVSGVHEPEVTDFFIKNIGATDHCLDVGANFGYYTCLMGRWAPGGKTVGIEPDRHVFELLRDNIYINCLEASTSPLQAAAGAAPGTLQMHRRVTRSGNTSISKAPEEFTTLLGEPSSEAFEVACVTIDGLLPEFGGRIDFIKIDAEGAEPLVFAGAGETVAANPNIRIVMEWSPGQIAGAGFDLGQFTAALQQMGLHAAVLEPGGTQPIEWDALSGISYLSGLLLTRGEA